jgi:predicted CopG family antitoxin
MVKIISISDEVYEDLSKIKNGKSFTELLKTLLTEHTSKGDPKNILAFLEANEPLSDKDANTIMTEVTKSRKNATTRKSASFA